MALDTRDIVSLFIDPDHADQFLGEILHGLLGLVSQIGAEVDGDHIFTAKALAAGIGEQNSSEEIGKIGLVFRFFLFLLFRVARKLRLLLGQLFELFVEAFVFLLLFVARQRTAVFGDQMPRLLAG